MEGRRSLKLLLVASRRINTAYVLKESFGQLWDYTREGWARRFFENWRDSLKWQRLKPYEKFARMIERHWDGIAAHCRTENKIAFGFVEGLKTRSVSSSVVPAIRGSADLVWCIVLFDRARSQP